MGQCFRSCHTRANAVKTVPYQYQRVGVRQLRNFLRRGKGALLADDPGLGKTFQSLLYVKKWCKRDKGPIVVICPQGLKWQWQQEAAHHVNISADVISGRKPERFMFRIPRMVIINYDILGDPRKSENSWVKELRRLKPSLVIIDEVHYIKDRSTIRYRACKYLCKPVKKIIGLSGTPATNMPAELWPFLNMARPDVFNSFWSFAHRFCGPRRIPWGSGWEFKGATNTKKLNRLLKQTCMIRRRKEDVLTDLPAKTRTVIPVDITNEKNYRMAEKDLIKWLILKRKKHKAIRAAAAESLVKVGYLKRLAAQYKMKETIKWIEDFLASGKKLVVFGIHRKILDMICEKFPGQYVRVDGRVTGHKRQMAVDAFNQKKSIKLFIGNIHAAGVGWSCKAASDVLFVELPWVPGTVTQAEDRIHGVGRGVKGLKANIWFIVARNTIEENLVKALHRKQKNLSRVLDGHKATKFDILELMQQSLLRRTA